MKVERLHDWQVSVTQAMDIQRELAKQVSRAGRTIAPRYIAGVDISAPRTGVATAAVVVLSYPELELVETRVVSDRLNIPYIPGLLSFRESPLILSACQLLSITPDLVLVDGQGVAHPRRIGLASHLGLLLDVPTIGCAKSRLCGEHDVPGSEPGSYTDLLDGDEVIGAVLRTRSGVKPIYVSVGHKIDLESAIHWVLECCRGFRLPEPTRLAHLAAGGNLKSRASKIVYGAGAQSNVRSGTECRS
ncbi:deoxyribonuclease V [Chloroflexota bacterium]